MEPNTHSPTGAALERALHARIYAVDIRMLSRGMTYFLLAIAICAEVAATTSMKLSEGFTKPIPSVLTVIGYGVSFYFLSVVLKSIPTGIAYAIWAGAGIVLITLIAWLFQGQKLDAPAIAGMALIIAGVLVMNLLSQSTPH
jgi:small multidrug resistance pump